MATGYWLLAKNVNIADGRRRRIQLDCNTEQPEHKERKASSPQKWAVWLAVDGDLRFLSHHDMMRAIERQCVRARLPLRYSQGFNPRPVLSLVLPRPVGVASREDLLAITLDAPLESAELLARLSATAPTGLSPHRAAALGPGVKPLARSADLELPLTPAQSDRVAPRVQALANQPAWPMRRVTGDESLDDPHAGKPIDLRPLVRRLELADGCLHLTLAPLNQAWARPAEVLRLLNLDERADLARMVRTRVDYGLEDKDRL
jgi:radical SAM-linked protein